MVGNRSRAGGVPRDALFAAKIPRPRDHEAKSVEMVPVTKRTFFCGSLWQIVLVSILNLVGGPNQPTVDSSKTQLASANECSKCGRAPNQTTALAFNTATEMNMRCLFLLAFGAVASSAFATAPSDEPCVCEAVSGKTCPCHVAALIDWFKAEGGIMGPLEFKDGGMWATEDIANGTVFLEAPHSVAFEAQHAAHDDLIAGAIELTHELIKARALPSHRFHLYATMLQPVCQLPFCGAPLPPNVSTTYYYENQVNAPIQNQIPKNMWNDFSLVLSRKWRNRMVPVFDLFNHDDVKGQPLSDQNGTFKFQANVDIKAGEQVFIHYGHHSSAYWLQGYNMDHSNAPDTCSDALLMRTPRHNDVQRYACFRDDKTHGYSDVANATMDAFKREDLPALKGLAEWLDAALAIV